MKYVLIYLIIGLLMAIPLDQYGKRLSKFKLEAYHMILVISWPVIIYMVIKNILSRKKKA